MEMKLEGEIVILDNGNVGYRQKVTLTNRRLIFIRKQGSFKEYEPVEEIPLEQIKEAYVHTGGVFSPASSVVLKMKNGLNWQLNISFGNGDDTGKFFSYHMATDLAIISKAVCDKWANAINQQLKLKVEDRTQQLEHRIRELQEN